MRVFISHSSQDKPAVLALAEALRAHGIDPWVDKWEIGSAGDFVGKINQGLHDADAGIIVLSDAAKGSQWVSAEVSYLIWAYVEEGKLLIPVILGDDAFIPPLLRPLIRHRITDVDAIADALHNRRPAPATPLGARAGHCHAVLVSLRRTDERGIDVTLDINGVRHGAATLPGLSYDLVHAQNTFLQGPVHLPRREFRAGDRSAQEAALAALGRHLGALCFPGDSGAALATLIDGCPVGTLIETVFAADDPELLGLAFEAARLPDGRVLALQPAVLTLRRPLTPPKHPPHAPLAGPLKILLAVAAPDAASGGGPLLDYEQETQNVLDAVRDAQTLENCEVRILELGHPTPIADAFSRDAYHVLHLSCHGGPGVLELEDEDGKPCPTTAQALLDPIRETHKPLPLVLLSACDTGVPAEQTASLAQDLLSRGVPAVVAMQAPVSATYATRLAAAFYRALATGEHLRPSLALAQARRQIERERLAAIGRGAPAADTQPEYATAALFVAATEQPVADFHVTKEPLHAPPVHVVCGPLPQLSLGELIGRRHELREALGVLRDPARRNAGVVLTGIGGIGKSALAGRIMCRLAEQGWLVPAVRGKFSLTEIAVAIGTELVAKDPASKLAQALLNPNLPDPARAQLLARALAEHPVLLVLDDFEQNLSVGGDAFLDPDTQDALATLADQARTGRLLITCRYPLPSPEGRFHNVAVPPLSAAETRKKLLRLPALAAQMAAGSALPRFVTGGHPRILEFLDALLGAAPGRGGPVAKKLRELASKAGVDPDQPAASLDAAVQNALALAGRDVLLPELLEIVRREGFEPALLQASVSNLSVTAAGLARMLAEDGPGDVAAAESALARLAALSLLYRDAADAALVHRWTAEGLKQLGDAEAHRARCGRAAAYRLWRYEHEGHALDDAVEALRNFLAGAAFDDAAGFALALLQALSAAQQSVAVAALAAEVLESLPADHPAYASIADAEARSHQALGFSDRALRRYQILLNRYEMLARAEPDRADYQRDLSVAYERMGDLYGALGQGEATREAYAKALEIRERLARAEPDRADYQRDLSVSYERMGRLYGALGQGEAAREFYLKDLDIAERLARAEPDRADYQRDLVVSLARQAQMTEGATPRGHLQRALGIVEALQASGRLAPADAGLLPALRQMLDALPP